MLITRRNFYTMRYLNKLIPVSISIYLGCILLFFSLSVSGQVVSQGEKDLRGQLNRTLPDTNRVNLELKLSMLYFCIGVSKPIYLDSTCALYTRAEALSKKLHSVNWENECLQVEARYYFEKANFKKGESCIQELINNWHVGHDTLKIANSWHFAAALLPAWSNNLCEGKILCLTHAIGIYKYLNDKLDVTNTFKDEADAHLNQGKLDLAEKELFLVLDQYKAIHFVNLHHTYFLLSEVYRLKGNLHKQLYYALATVKSMKATGDSSAATLFYVKLSDVYKDLGMYDNSLIFLNKVLAKNRNDPESVSVFSERIIKLLIKQNKKGEAFAFLKKNVISPEVLANGGGPRSYMAIADCYLALGEYKQAEPYILKMLHESENVEYLVNNPMEANLGLYNLACDFFLKTNQYKEAEIYLQKLQELPPEVITPVFRSGMELFQFKIDSAAGEYISAMHHFQFYKFLSDSLYNVTKSKQIEELQISYETSQKDNDLKSLKKQSQMQQAIIGNKNLIAQLMISGVVLLMMVIVGLYSRYRNNRRHNQVLQSSQQEIAAKNTILEKLLADNEWLLREVHHRVKNNLHVITGLLQSQSAYMEDGFALNAMRDSRNRVQSMALIHQKLYMNHNVTEIYLPEFVRELVDNLKDSFDIGLDIYFQIEIAPIMLDATYVVPIGLILNEAITNAIKHAFPHSDADTISIKLAPVGDNRIMLIIADNGKGLPPNVDIDLLKSFGLQLIAGLVKELGGRLNIEGPPGTRFAIAFETTHAAR
jgi:two-component system, sensor histidine kinase PdtaS